jgi:hypothetical protein
MTTNLRAAAEYTVNQRVVQDSRDVYSSKIKRIKAYLLTREDSFETIDLHGDIILPLSSQVFKDLFTWLSTTPELAKQRQNKALNDIVNEEDALQSREDINENVDDENEVVEEVTVGIADGDEEVEVVIDDVLR